MLSVKFAPILLVSGVMAFKRSASTLVRDLGRVAIGLGLMLLSLHILLTSLAPAENAPVVRELLGDITDEPLLTLLMGAILTWAPSADMRAAWNDSAHRLFSCTRAAAIQAWS